MAIDLVQPKSESLPIRRLIILTIDQIPVTETGIFFMNKGHPENGCVEVNFPLVGQKDLVILRF
ncbi:MAG: hypothetical protein RIM99_18940 [Cyclobacteriaceae bacterium]